VTKELHDIHEKKMAVTQKRSYRRKSKEQKKSRIVSIDKNWGESTSFCM